MGARRRSAGLAIGLLAGLEGASALFAWTFGFAPALGPGLRLAPDLILYPPWAILLWRARFADAAPEALRVAGMVVLLGALGGLALGGAAAPAARRRARGWGDLAEARRAGLLQDGGCVLGEFRGRILATRDLRPSLVTGGTRSGKGRGHVIPTLLSWTQSVLVHDPKGELWRTTAGWRGGFSHVLRFAPRDLASARWNPLAEVRPGPQELAQVQRLVAILADPAGAHETEAIWDRAAAEILQALILHVLYTARDAEKTLLTVRDLLADLDAAAETMAATLHRPGPGGDGEVHPFIRTAARGYAAMHDRFRTSVQGTARSYLAWLAGDDVERALSTSDFALADLMCADAPVSLYVQVAPADAQALKPLVRLFFQAAAQALTVEETADDQGRPKRRQLLLLMDEFPLLGRLAFFEKHLRLMSGYGLKAMCVAQSLNDIVETYGANNTLLDNCHVYAAFAALDPLTQEKVSRLTGSVAEPRLSRSRPAGLAGGHASVTTSQIDRPLLEPGEVRALGDAEQLVFVAGRRPLLVRKLRYDRREPFRSRAALPPPAPGGRPDTPGVPPHPWSGRRGLGIDPEAEQPLFKEAAAARLDRDVAKAKTLAYQQAREEMAQNEAALDHVKERSGG